MDRLVDMFKSIKDDSEENKSNLAQRRQAFEKVAKRASSRQELEKMEL